MFTAHHVRYEIADRQRGVSHGGIGAIHTMARQIGLIDAIDDRLKLLKIHLPFHESDHVLNFAYNALCEGTCLQDIELRRNDEVFLDALKRPADPRSDYRRRFLPTIHQRGHRPFAIHLQRRSSGDLETPAQRIFGSGDH